jgi:hypothetical protein
VRIDRGDGADGADGDDARPDHPDGRPDDAEGRPDAADATGGREAKRAGLEQGGDQSTPGDGSEPDDGAVPAERVIGYRGKVEAVRRAYAIDQGCAEVEKIETDTVTPAMLRIEAEDPGRCLVGFENRLKGKDRLAEKVTKAVDEQPNLSYEDAFAVVKDAIRYTFQYPHERYTAGVRADIERLIGLGFDRVDRRNTWASEVYKGINSRWRVPENSRVFEVQFHTEASYEAKQETHAAYERLRDPATPKDEQERLVEYQRAINARVPTPPGAADLPDYP